MLSASISSMLHPNAKLQRALKYLAWFGVAYSVFIFVYSIFYFNFVAKGGTQFSEHVFWWLKLSGIWYFTAPLALILLSIYAGKRPLSLNYILLGVPLVLLAVTIQIIFDFSYLRHDIIGYFVLFLPKQLAIYSSIFLYWYLMIAQQTTTTDKKPSQYSSTQPINTSTSSPYAIELEYRGRLMNLDANSIYLIRSAGNYVEIESSRGQFLKRASLKQMLSELPDYFTQCHRSYIVNLSKVTAIQNQHSGNAIAILDNDEHVSISKRCKSALKKQLAKYPVNSQ